mmetsp:Transcript_41745/g.110101  ORF Transcript_41745/g.110101 Transcript_41745/m.110101 type:complete len:242 (+) Transcript_41745:321-1046(+)
MDLEVAKHALCPQLQLRDRAEAAGGRRLLSRVLPGGRVPLVGEGKPRHEDLLEIRTCWQVESCLKGLELAPPPIDAGVTEGDLEGGDVAAGIAQAQQEPVHRGHIWKVALERGLRHGNREAGRTELWHDTARSLVDPETVAHGEGAAALATHHRIILRMPLVWCRAPKIRHLHFCLRRHCRRCRGRRLPGLAGNEGLDLHMELAGRAREGGTERNAVDLRELRGEVRAPIHALAVMRAHEC